MPSVDRPALRRRAVARLGALALIAVATSACQPDRLVTHWPGGQGDAAARLMIEIDHPLPPALSEFAPSPFLTPPPVPRASPEARPSGSVPSGSVPSSSVIVNLDALPPPTVPTTRAPTVPPDTAAVALLLPLSGPSRDLADSMLDAALLAVSEMAAPDFLLLPYDTRGTAQGAVFAAQAALRDGAGLILGPLYAASATAVAPEARAAGVSVVAFSNDRLVAGDGVYVLGFLPEDQVRHVLDFAVESGLRRFAALAPRNDFGVAVVQAMRTALDGPLRLSGAGLARVAFYDPQSGDVAPVVRELADYDARRGALESQIAELKAAGDDPYARQALKRLETLEAVGEVEFDAVLIAEAGDRLRAIAPLLPFYEVDPARVRFLGTVLWDDPALGGEPALRGAWFAAPGRAQRRDFVGRYERAFGRKPEKLASLAYDATALAAVLAAQGAAAPDPAAAARPGMFSTAALETSAGFAGVDGIFRLRSDGVVERGLALLEIRQGGPVEIETAPDFFAAPPVVEAAPPAAAELPAASVGPAVDPLAGRGPAAGAGPVDPVSAGAPKAPVAPARRERAPRPGALDPWR